MPCLIAPKWGFMLISQRPLDTPHAPPHSSLSLSDAAGMEAWPWRAVGQDRAWRWSRALAALPHVGQPGAGLPAASLHSASLSRSHWPGVGKGSAHLWTLAEGPGCQLSPQVGGEPLPDGTCCRAVFLETFGWNGGWSGYFQEGFLSLGHTFLTSWLLEASTDKNLSLLAVPTWRWHLVWMCGGNT